MIINKSLSAILALSFSTAAFSQPITGSYDSSHQFIASLGKTSKTVKLSYRSFNNSVALSACEFHCQTEYLGFDKNNSNEDSSVYKSLQGNYLIQLNKDQWLYLPDGQESRLLTLQESNTNKAYSLNTARKKVKMNYSGMLAAE